MGEHVGMVVTDGRVLLGSEIEAAPELAVIPREVELGDQKLRSDERVNMIRSLAREASSRGRPPKVLPPQREHFLNTYLALAEQHPHIISIHHLASLDGAAREARICRQLMHPLQHIDVYETKTLEGGLEFVLKTALTLTQEGASATQLLALLRYLETHMLTFLLTPGAARPQPWASVSTGQRLMSMWPSTETLWHFDPKQRRLVVVAQGRNVAARVGPILQQRWGPLRYTAALRYRGYSHAQLEQITASLQASGLPELPRREPVAATFIPLLPHTFVELLLLPTEADLLRLRGLVQDPIWWKGAA
jgi:hypothetical protein